MALVLRLPVRDYRQLRDCCQPPVLHKVDQWLSRLLPRPCVLCGQRAGERSLCAGCIADLPWIARGCMRCAAPLPVAAASGCCARCDLTMRGIDRIVAALVYQYPVDHLITAAKFAARPEFAVAAGDALAHALVRAPAGSRVRPDVVVPVPLHPARLAQRGFNQALEIAGPVCRTLGLSLNPRCCRRRRNTVPQTGLTAVRRHANLHGAFVTTGDLSGAQVAIVDDVVTTGSTVSALAACLREAGAGHVVVWAVARVVRNQPDMNV